MSRNSLFEVPLEASWMSRNAPLGGPVGAVVDVAEFPFFQVPLQASWISRNAPCGGPAGVLVNVTECAVGGPVGGLANIFDSPRLPPHDWGETSLSVSMYQCIQDSQTVGINLSI